MTCVDNTETLKDEMTKLALTESAGKFLLTVPYALNPAFRELFKTAQWNSSARAFEVRATTQNRNKWDKFIRLSLAAANALVSADEAEATADELQRADRQLEELLDSLNRREAVARKQIAELGPKYENAQRKYTELEANVQRTEAERDRIIAPVLALYEKHRLDAILRGYLYASRQGFSGKKRCSEEEDRLIELRDALHEIGYTVPAMDVLLHTSLNRPDKLLANAEALERQKISGIEALASNDAEQK